MTKIEILALSAGVATLCLLQTSAASAHGIAGNRTFPATLTVDDPAVADEASLPTIQYMTNQDGTHETDINGEFSKRITERFAVSFATGWSQIRPGPSGWRNAETTFKYLLFVDDPHEVMLSAGLTIEWGRTGAQSLGVDNFNTFRPQLYFGKGFGDLPNDVGWLRPFALTGQLGYGIPERARTTTFGGFDPDTGNPVLNTTLNPRVVNWGLTLQYSLPYLNANVRQIDGPDIFKQLVPIVETSFLTPVSNSQTGYVTTGTVAPGVIWQAGAMQYAVEALIPINNQSGRHIGVIGQVHFYLDDIFPTTIGKPIF